MLFSASNKSSVESLLVLYTSFVYCDIINGIIFWGSNINHLNRMFKLQKRSLRIIKKLKPRETCTPLFKQFKLLTVPSIYILNSIMSRKSHPEYYEYNENIHNYSTRNKSKSVVPKHSTNLVKKSPRKII
jgi:hypothetical protein